MIARHRWIALTLAVASIASVATTASAQLAPAAGGPDAQTADAQRAKDDEEARALFNLGREAYAEARYERALKYFQQAHRLSGRPALLYNVAAALDRLRRDREALDGYREYLKQAPDAENRNVVEARITVLEKAIAEREAAATAAPSPEQVAAAASVDSAPVTTDDQPGPSGGVLTKWWFWGGVGAVALTAVIVGVAASSGGDGGVAAPPTLDASTRVREL